MRGMQAYRNHNRGRTRTTKCSNHWHILAAVIVGWRSAQVSAAVGTAFTYQGDLHDNDQAVTGTCDFEFTLWDTDVADHIRACGTIPNLEARNAALEERFTKLEAMMSALQRNVPGGAQ